jgi:hypothetical protein
MKPGKDPGVPPWFTNLFVYVVKRIVNHFFGC